MLRQATQGRGGARVIRAAVRTEFQSSANQVKPMKATIVGLVTPHLLRIIDLARQAETGVNVDWHLRDAVARTIDDLGRQYNAADLLSAYAQGLENAAQEAAPARKAYARVLQAAATHAQRNIGPRD